MSGRGRHEQEHSFDAVFEGHREAAFAYLLSHARDRDLASDLLQETFLRVWRHMEEVAALPKERQRFWIFKAAKSALIQELRRRQVRASLESPMPAAEPAAFGGNPQRELESEDDHLRTSKAIEKLPVSLREVLLLSVMGGLNSQDIGRALKRPAGTVRYQLSEARRLLANEVGRC